jgi:hypothetical protein
MQFDEAQIGQKPDPAVDERRQPKQAGDRVTLVLAKSGMESSVANAMVTRLDSEPVEYVYSFAAGCQVIIANRASQIVIIETARTALNEFEVQVLQHLSEGIPVVRLLIPEWRTSYTASRVRADGRDTAGQSNDAEKQVGRLRVLRNARHFCVDELHVPITHAESAMLWMLASRGVVTEAVLRQVFRNPQAPAISSVVRQYVFRLRRKLELSGGAACIVSVRNGYALEPRYDDASEEPPPSEDQVPASA